ncbi:ribosomal protein L7Ae/L30e/S12e/Gadd45 [Tanacetum coccineum]
MLYCIVAEEQYNLAYFFVKRIECARATLIANLPYGMFLTRLYRHVMELYPYLGPCILQCRSSLSMRPTRRDDDENDGASRASTPSPTTYLNSLKPLNYQRYKIPSPSQQNDDLLFERQTELLNQTQDIHKENRGGFKSFGKALRGVFGKKKKFNVKLLSSWIKALGWKCTKEDNLDYVELSVRYRARIKVEVGRVGAREAMTGTEGVCYAKKDFNLAKHPEINVPNLQVVKLMKNFKSKEYVKETFAGMHYYWFFQWSLRQNRCRQTQILVTEMVTVVVQRGPCWGIRSFFDSMVNVTPCYNKYVDDEICLILVLNVIFHGTGGMPNFGRGGGGFGGGAPPSSSFS